MTAPRRTKTAPPNTPEQQARRRAEVADIRTAVWLSSRSLMPALALMMEV